MQLNLNGVSVTVSEPEISKIVLAHIRGEAPAANDHGPAPRIGEPWPGQGGFYAGIMRGRDGGHDYHLIVGPEIAAQNWAPAVAAAAEIEHEDHHDYTLPYRAEQVYQILRKRFEGKA